MKTLRITLLLFIGIVIGIAGTNGWQHYRRTQAIRSLPSLADRIHPPKIDEISSVTLSRRDGRLDRVIRDGMGTPRPDFNTLLAQERLFSSEPPIMRIEFEPGVSMEDLEATIAELADHGVERYFLGSVYGKLVR